MPGGRKKELRFGGRLSTVDGKKGGEVSVGRNTDHRKEKKKKKRPTAKTFVYGG